MAGAGTFVGHGTKFALKSGASTYTDIDGVSQMSHGSNKVDVTDVTDLTTAGWTRVFQPGLENPGEFTLKMNMKPGNTSQEALKAAKDSTVHDFKITYPGTIGTDSFSGIITGIDRDIPDDKPVTMSVKIQVTGPVVFAAGS